jgi:hypothetical protein
LIIERVYGRRKRYIKIHFAVDIKTKEVISMDVTMDDVHDSEVLPRLLKDASMNRDVIEAFMDGAYDTGNSYIFLRRMGVLTSWYYLPSFCPDDVMHCCNCSYQLF